MMPTLRNFAAGVGLSTAMLLNYACFAGDWQKDWSTVEGQSAKKNVRNYLIVFSYKPFAWKTRSVDPTRCKAIFPYPLI
ncbi:MAG TPA: hypothetical protein VFC29_15775 [Candidatus Limnocylindrales bacterium]|nr:hypothetical protein [Candidatus Limnocylindrales bacterium]